MLERIRKVAARLTGPESRAARVGLALALCVACGVLLFWVNRHYPVGRWLFWMYAQYWLLALGFSAACTSAGLQVLRALGPRHLPLTERLILAMAAGVLVFFTGMFLGGVLGLFGAAFAVAWPLLMFGSGAVPLYRLSRRAWRHLRAARRRARPLGGWSIVALAFGGLGLVMVYVNILTPDNAAYDSRWYHLSLAEHYAAAGGIARSPEGWFQATLPQLASLIYLWPHLFEKMGTFSQVEIAAHLEMVLFLWTLAGIPVLVRRMVPGAPVSATWTALFLFSGIFLYDSILSLAADHVAAFWAIPIYLGLLRAWRRLDVRACLLLAIGTAGAFLTKYQAAEILAFPFLAIAVRALWLLLRQRNGRVLLGPLALAGAFLLFSASHWLKNWVWYGDPFYPVLHKHLALRPWHQDSEHLYRTLVDRHFWRPKGTSLQKARATVEALFTFSFRPHDWYHFHRDWPVFGFLFTLSWFVMPFVRAPRRLWALFLAGHVAVLVWFRLSHQDRYLQIIVPWMAAHLAATIILAWRMGWLARVPLMALLGLQVVWGTSAYFIPAHIYTQWPIVRTIDFLSSGYKGQHKERFNFFPEFAEIGRSMPKDGKVLLHRFETHAGIRRMSAMDHPSWQGLINYGRLGSHQKVFELLRGIGVTHVAWVQDDWLGEDTLAGDLRFSGFVTHVLKPERLIGGIRLAEMPEQAPPAVNEKVLYLGCAGYSPGLYHLNQLLVPGREPPPGTEWPSPQTPLVDNRQDTIEALAAQANYLVLNTSCPDRANIPAATALFERRAGRNGESIFVRRLPLP